MAFDSNYYDDLYFSDLKGKAFKRPDGSIDHWGYKNEKAEWLGCGPIVKTWKDIFNLSKCNTDSGLCKSLDIGCGRGTFVAYMRDIGVEAWGFDFSKWAVENRYPRCENGWIRVHDATQGWPYGDKAFDFVFALDFFEHVYIEDINFIVKEIYRVSKKWIFLQIATIGGGSGSSIHEKSYTIKKGETIPIELEGMAVAGHVTVQNQSYWIERLCMLGEREWVLRDDLVDLFVKKVNQIDPMVLNNWTKNLMLILERV